MGGVQFPEIAEIQLMAGTPPEPLALPGVVFAVRLLARRKNDYVLAPFTSDAAGVVRITREACSALVEAEHDSGLMDYVGIHDCNPRVEIRPLTYAEIERAKESRRTVWQELLRGEDRLFGSMERLLAIYDRASNAELDARTPPLRPFWDGTEQRPSYDYVVERVAPTSRVGAAERRSAE